MPCEPRERKKFEVWRQEKQEQKQKENIGFNFRKEVNNEGNEIYNRLKSKLDDHIKALDDLKKKLSEATSELEKDRLRKEIDELEKELQGFEDTIRDLMEFVRDVERRTISIPNKNAD